MTFLAARYRRSHTPKSSSDKAEKSSFLSTRFPSMNLSTPAVYQSQDTQDEFPQPKPSTSWTTQMSTLAHKIRDNAASMNAIISSTSDTSITESLDRKSISQGMKLVAIAADEFDEGNDAIALEIYLSGIDKILMALPSKCDFIILVSNIDLVRFRQSR